MKKLLLLTVTVLLFSCGDNDDSNSDSTQNFLDEVRSNVYKETGTATYSGASGDIIYNYTQFWEFKLDTYAYTRNGVNDGPSSSECYTTFNQYYGAITSEESDGITYLSNDTTIRVNKQSGGIRVTFITDDYTNIKDLVNSSSTERAEAIAGKRSSNTCD